MSNFRIKKNKNTKKESIKNSSTLDKKHRQKVKQFNNKKNLAIK